MLVALLTKLNKTRISEKLCTVTELTSFCLLLNDLVICSQFNVANISYSALLSPFLHLLYLWSLVAPYLSSVTRPVQESATFFFFLFNCMLHGYLVKFYYNLLNIMLSLWSQKSWYIVRFQIVTPWYFVCTCRTVWFQMENYHRQADNSSSLVCSICSFCI